MTYLLNLMPFQFLAQYRIIKAEKSDPCPKKHIIENCIQSCNALVFFLTNSKCRTEAVYGLFRL